MQQCYYVEGLYCWKELWYICDYWDLVSPWKCWSNYNKEFGSKWSIVFIMLLEKVGGGGVGVMLRRALMVVSTEYFTKYRSFEAIGIQMRVLSKVINIVVIYHPPSSSGNNSMSCFMEDSSLLEDYFAKSGSLITAGGFNFHIFWRLHD